MTTETKPTTIAEFAQIAYDSFESFTRGDKQCVKLKDDHPEWVLDAVRDAHEGRLPDDWTYDKCQDCFGWVSDADDARDVSDIIDSGVVGADIYTSDLCEWLAGGHMSDVDDAQDEYGLMGNNGQSDICCAIQYAQVRVIEGILRVCWDYCAAEVERAELEVIE